MDVGILKEVLAERQLLEQQPGCQNHVVFWALSVEVISREITAFCLGGKRILPNMAPT